MRKKLSERKVLLHGLKHNIRKERKLTRQITRKYTEYTHLMAERQFLKDSIVKLEMKRENAQSLPSVEECLSLPESK